jgi:nicotinate phosphoribosyltransferase
VYKEVLYVDENGTAQPRMKLAGEKSTWPGKKEVYRIGNFEEDIVQLDWEPRPIGGRRLLKPVVRNRAILPGSLPPLSEIRELAEQNLRELPEHYRALHNAPRYLVRFSDALIALRH